MEKEVDPTNYRYVFLRYTSWSALQDILDRVSGRLVTKTKEKKKTTEFDFFTQNLWRAMFVA